VSTKVKKKFQPDHELFCDVVTLALTFFLCDGENAENVTAEIDYESA